MAATVDVVICVHNALEDVRACLDSLWMTAPLSPFKLILIDDGSDDETKAYLEAQQDRPGVTLLRSDEPTGYTKAANRGLRLSTAHRIVLLNSDTIVPRQWLVKLNATADRYADAGMLGPLSNAATWQSVPEVFDEDGAYSVNPLPLGVSVDEYDAQLRERAADILVRPRVPLLNGFCIMLKRDLINKIGYLDEIAFPRGYGEENDYCFRATDAGFGLLVAIDTYVFHQKSKSYGKSTRQTLAQEGRQAFLKKYPRHRIDGAVESMRYNPILAEVRQRMRD